MENLSEFGPLGRPGNSGQIVEAIEIVSGIETLDNWGNVETLGPKEIINILEDPSTWTDDHQFMDKSGNVYTIDDLINKAIVVGRKRFTVIEESVKNTFFKKFQRTL
jgi:hypothetical protein